MKTFLALAVLLTAPVFTFAQTPTLPGMKQLMTPDEFTAAGLPKLNEKELTALNEWMRSYTLRVAQAVTQSGGAAPRKALSFEQLLGCVIVADDGEFLGTISTNAVDAKSILNQVGRHGSEVSSVSIFNSVGRYGSEVSGTSAFNEIASRPPKIINRDGQFVAFLTKNAIKTPRVDTHALIGWLKSQ